MAAEPFAEIATQKLRKQHSGVFSSIVTTKIPVQATVETGLLDVVSRRVEVTQRLTMAIVEGAHGASQHAADLLARWMDQGSVVRIIGMGSTRLAAAIPARRLSDGGARVHLQDDMLPMPNSLHGGGIIAVSTEEHCDTVTALCLHACQRNRDLKIIGFGPNSANELRELCDAFLGIPQPSDYTAAREARLDIDDYAILQVLDTLIVYAGTRLGYTESRWQLRREDLGISILPSRKAPIE